MFTNLFKTHSQYIKKGRRQPQDFCNFSSILSYIQIFSETYDFQLPIRLPVIPVILSHTKLYKSNEIKVNQQLIT